MSNPSPHKSADPAESVSRSAVFVGELPLEDLRQQASKRLRIYALIWAGLWGLGLLMNNVIGPILSPDKPIDDAWPIPGNPVAALMIAVSIGLVWYSRRPSSKPQTVLDWGLAYEVVLAFGIGLVNQWTPNTIGLSWICVLVLLHPLVVPNRPLKTVIAALLAASMDPVGLALTVARGVPLPPAEQLLWTYLPNYICAALTLVPSRLLTELGRRVVDAEQMGSYRLGKLLAEGGMGQVYLAQHHLLRRPAAIKLVRPQQSGGSTAEELLVRFRREAEAAATLQSSHTIMLYDFGITGRGQFYYVMELLDGLDLERLIERFGPVPAGRALHFAKQTCQSLAEAHAMGLVHRDIKPANLFSCRHGLEADFIKVLDFGLVKFLSEDLPSELQSVAVRPVPGTPAYMAPELIQGATASAQADIYSLGCVLYWLLTGVLVFEAQTTIRMLLAHSQDAPIPPSSRCELPIPPAVDSLVMACLEKDPANRPGSATQLLAQLEACAIDEPWTQEHAERWWRRHLPDVPSKTIT